MPAAWVWLDTVFAFLIGSYPLWTSSRFWMQMWQLRGTLHCLDFTGCFDFGSGTIISLILALLSLGRSNLHWLLSSWSKRPGITLSWTNDLTLALRSRKSCCDFNYLNSVADRLQDHMRWSCVTSISSNSSAICILCSSLKGSMSCILATMLLLLGISSIGISSSDSSV